MSNETKDWLKEIEIEKQNAKSKGMCFWCDPDSSQCDIYQDPLTKDWYLDIQTGEWDSYNDDYVYQKVYITHCPNCGRELSGKQNSNLTFSTEELSYIKKLVHESKESLDDCCIDRVVHPGINWMNQSDVDKEYELLDSLLVKLEGFANE